MANKEPRHIKDQYEDAEARRSSFMSLCREYAALTIADVLPPLNSNLDNELPACWRNIGGVGVENMVGRIMTSLFGVPWFRVVPSAEVRSAVDRRQLTAAEYNAFVVKLAVRELLGASKFEATNYRVAKRAAMESIVICGNSLTRIARDYNHRYYRFDQWVCKRSGSGALLWTITREAKNALELTAEQRAKAKIKDDDEENHDLYTRCRRIMSDNPDKPLWVIEQEIDGHIVTEAGAPYAINPYKCVTYRLVPGEDYARGFISTRYPDLKSVNNLWESLIFGMGNAAKCVPVVDPSDPTLRPKDLLKPNGVPIAGRVVQGVIQGFAFAQTNKGADFGVALQGTKELEASLARAMLLERESMPTGDRVTATAVMRIARELEGALGGPYIQIAEQLQKPDIEQVFAMMEADGTMLPIDRRLLKTEILTGAAALSKQMDLDNLLTALQIVSTYPEGLNRINLDVVLDRVFMGLNVDTAGLMKTAEQLQAELQQRMREQIMPDAAKQAFKSLGDMAVQRAAQP